MVKDFDSDTLPVDESHTFDTQRAKKFSPSTWSHIFAAGADLLSACLKKSTATGGWIIVHDEIAIFALPQSSLMRFYWANEMATVVNRTKTSVVSDAQNWPDQTS